MKKAIVNTSNDKDLGIEMFNHSERGRCVRVRKLYTFYSLYFTFLFQATQEFSKGDPVVEYCGKILSEKDGDEQHGLYTKQNEEGANWGSYMFKINVPAGTKYW